MDLTLAQTDDLMRELMRRYDHTVFAGLRTGDNKDEPDIRSWRFEGNTETCQGLCAGLTYHIQKHADSVEEPMNKEEL